MDEAAGDSAGEPADAMDGVLRYKRALFQDGYLGGIYTLAALLAFPQVRFLPARRSYIDYGAGLWDQLDARILRFYCRQTQGGGCFNPLWRRVRT